VQAAQEKQRRDEAESARTRKLKDHKDNAIQYMQAANQQAARRKGESKDDFRPPPVLRSQTFQEPPYSVRYEAAQPAPYAHDDNDTPRRSSARTSTRRASEQVSSRSREQPRSSGKERKSSTTPYERDPYIIDAPSPPPTTRKPSLQTHQSAPPIIPATTSRDKPARSKTMQSEYVKKDSTAAPPPVARAATFQTSRGSNLKKSVDYTSDESSDSDSPIYATTKPRSRSPPPRRYEPEHTRYIIDQGRSVPITTRGHRADLREDSYSDRDRSESPRGGRRSGDQRPPLVRSDTHHASHHTSARAQAYYPVAPEPQIIPVRPKMPSSHRTDSTRGYVGEVNIGKSYAPEHVVYQNMQRPGYASYPSHRPQKESVY